MNFLYLWVLQVSMSMLKLLYSQRRFNKYLTDLFSLEFTFEPGSGWLHRCSFVFMEQSDLLEVELAKASIQ